jgi:hypothetical protein
VLADSSASADDAARPYWPVQGTAEDLFNAVQDWVAHELRGERPSSLDGTGIPEVTSRSSA